MKLAIVRIKLLKCVTMKLKFVVVARSSGLVAVAGFAKSIWITIFTNDTKGLLRNIGVLKTAKRLINGTKLCSISSTFSLWSL